VRSFLTSPPVSPLVLPGRLGAWASQRCATYHLRPAPATSRVLTYSGLGVNIALVIRKRFRAFPVLILGLLVSVALAATPVALSAKSQRFTASYTGKGSGAVSGTTASGAQPWSVMGSQFDAPHSGARHTASSLARHVSSSAGPPYSRAQPGLSGSQHIEHGPAPPARTQIASRSREPRTSPAEQGGSEALTESSRSMAHTRETAGR